MKKTVLKGWVEKVLSGVVITWLFFVGTTIDNVLDNKVYDTILVVWTILALGSFYLITKYGKSLDEEIEEI